MQVSFAIFGAICAAAFSASALRAQQTHPQLLPNAGFEAGAEAWHSNDSGMSAVVPEAARSGGLGLRITDRSDSAGSNFRSARIPVAAGKNYDLSFWARPTESNGVIGVYIQYFDASRAKIDIHDPNSTHEAAVRGSIGEWSEFSICSRAPENAATLSIWTHSYNAAVCSADFDDFTLVELSDEEAEKKRRDRIAASPRGFPSPDAARVAEIASWLSGAPQGIGRPVSDRNAWERLAALPEAAGIIRGAANIIDKEPPELPDELYLDYNKTGSRASYMRPYETRAWRLRTLMIAECLENKGRFLPPLERDILAMCGERSWVMPAHDSSLGNFNGTRISIDLGSSARAWLLATADWWLGERLSPAVRERLRAEAMRRVVGPYFAAVRANNIGPNWWMRCLNNWNAVCSANVIGAALALVESREERAEALAAMEISIPYYIAGFTDDGYCSEGMGYWNYGFGHFMKLGLAVRGATGGRLDIFQGAASAKLQRIAAYAQGYQIQAGNSPWFADGGGEPNAEVWAMMRQVWPGIVPPGAPEVPLLHGGHTLLGLRAFGQEPPDGAQKTADARLPLRTFFNDAQVLVTRSADASAPPFGAAIKGGHNAENHNHNDIGSYAVVLDGVEMLGDPGGEIYTSRTFSARRYESAMLNSRGHPVPVVAGQLQSGEGREFSARVISHSFTDELDVLELDLAAAYRVPGLTKLLRAYAHDRAARAISITDEAAFSAPQPFSVPLVTYREIERKDAATLLLGDGARRVELRIETEGGAWRLDEELIENPGKPSPRRLAITFEQPVQSARVRLTITPLAAPAPSAD